VAKHTPRLFGATWHIVAGGFQTMMIGLAPPFALIVKDAARVERDIAADRSHVAMGRPGDLAGRLRYCRIVLQHARMCG
jgi:hypothetical protein